MPELNKPNPYGPPEEWASQAADSRGVSRRWPVLVINCGFTVLNFGLMAFAHFVFADLVVEIEIQLSAVSSLAYQIAKTWIVSIPAMLIFAVSTTFIGFNLKRAEHPMASWFFMILISIWALFTIGFAFGILQPLYKVITGLTD